MNVRNLKMNDTFERYGNKYVIEKGLRKLQLTETELLDLQKQLNKFVLHNVSVNEVAVCHNCGDSRKYNAEDGKARCKYCGQLWQTER